MKFSSVQVPVQSLNHSVHTDDDGCCNDHADPYKIPMYSPLSVYSEKQSVVTSSTSFSSAASSISTETDARSHPSVDGDTECRTAMSKSQMLKQRRKMIEEWNHQRKMERTYEATSHDSVSTPLHSQRICQNSSFLHPTELDPVCSMERLSNPSLATPPAKMGNEERRRVKRILQRLRGAETYLSKQLMLLAIRGDRFQGVDYKRSVSAWKERSEAQLRLSQVESAIAHYEQKLDSKTTTAVPKAVTKTVSSLQSIWPACTLTGELEHDLALLCERNSAETMSRIIADMKLLNQSASFPILPVGSAVSQVLLPSFYRKGVSTHKLHHNSNDSWFTCVIVYWGSWSPFCMTTLRTWQNDAKLIKESGGELVALGMEPVKGCKQSSSKCGATFPLLSDPTGQVLSQLGLLVPKHPMTRLNSASPSHFLPLAATLVISREGVLVFSHTAVDPTDRVGSKEVLQTIVSQRDENAPPTQTSSSSGRRLQRGVMRLLGRGK
eukprot:Nitzschia sp. Nitz4//scaffold108_size72880//38402//39886//NITZ4_005817-RA/size72880-processed-gene-0.80-mRNA-1//1//CDS//3329532675//482//frame0